ncbi:MAG: type II toxin-antitoxin system PemK/MazF family toxin [Solobacterium sp.]|nr:type II toxin-antitoxin system PemK/MazF family toxin [Solobacterium sp.]
MNVYEASRQLLSGTGRAGGIAVPPEWNSYVQARKSMYGTLMPDYIVPNMRSEAMWVLRGRCCSGEEVGVEVKRGDVCWMDYGQTFLYEMGYQHFGLVLSLCNKKALIVPLTSNRHAYEKAGDPSHPCPHLMRIGQLEGLHRPSTLFLNDLRFVNTARILEIRAHLDPDSELFQLILSRIEAIVSGG